MFSMFQLTIKLTVRLRDHRADTSVDCLRIDSVMAGIVLLRVVHRAAVRALQKVDLPGTGLGKDLQKEKKEIVKSNEGPVD